MIMLPTMSAGIRSGVNWMREYFSCSTRARVRSSVVLPKSGNAFEQHVPAREQADQDAIDHFLLADDDFPDLVTNFLELAGG